jgi:hypothetical protein
MSGFKINTDIGDPFPHTWEEKPVEEEPPEVFDEDYYLRGPETGKSNYENYSWKGELTLTYAIYLRRHLGIKDTDTVLDVGAARGFLVKALRMGGICAMGQDISKWAIENCDPSVKHFVSNELKAEPLSFDWIHMKDVAEHCTEDHLKKLCFTLFRAARKGCFFIVPLTSYFGGKYLYPADNQDSTHIIRFTIMEWIQLFKRVADEVERQTGEQFTVMGGYHMHGLKQASVDFPMSTGFFKITRF